ncbi:MAG: plasmid pRiA4b ORF-3 family protein [Bacteroidales bacterium]|nr:plasmid pRiA4b ORF-3 family protein [Bacteroidales bacterium]
MVYKFVVLSDEDETFIRELEFLDSHTLLDFHNLLQDELEFDKSQMASFFMATDNWEKEEEFTLFDMGTGSSTMESAVLEEVIFRKNQKLIYVFDFFNERSLFVEFTGEAKEVEAEDYPVCTNSKGVPPKQVLFGGRSRKLYNNIVVSDDDDDDEPEVDDLFLNGDDEETPPDFENIDNLGEDEE